MGVRRLQTVIFHAHGYPGIRDDHVGTGYLVNVTSDGNGSTGFRGPSASSFHKIGFRLEIGGSDNTDVQARGSEAQHVGIGHIIATIAQVYRFMPPKPTRPLFGA